MPAGVAHDADEAGHFAPGGADRYGQGDQTGLDQLVVQGPAVVARPLRTRGELLLVRGRARGDGGEVQPLRVRGPVVPPSLPLPIVPAGRQQRSGGGAFGGQQIADPETQRHRATTGGLVDEADAVAVADREGHRLVEFVGERVGTPAEQRGKAECGEIGVAQFHQARREGDLAAVHPYVLHARQGRGDPVDRGPGKTGGALDGARAHRPALVGEPAQDRDPAHERGDGFGRCRRVGLLERVGRWHGLSVVRRGDTVVNSGR